MWATSSAEKWQQNTWFDIYQYWTKNGKKGRGGGGGGERKTQQIGLVVQLSLTGKKQCGEVTLYTYMGLFFGLVWGCLGGGGGGGSAGFWSRMQPSFLYSLLSHHSAILTLGLNSSTVQFTLITLTNFCTLPKKKKLGGGGGGGLTFKERGEIDAKKLSVKIKNVIKVICNHFHCNIQVGITGFTTPKHIIALHIKHSLQASISCPLWCDWLAIYQVPFRNFSPFCFFVLFGKMAENTSQREHKFSF